MKIAEIKLKPRKVRLPDGSDQTLQQMFELYKLENDKDAKEVLQLFADIVTIIDSYEVGDATYLYVRRDKQIKIAL